ncbi:Baculoviral IAP repeat-containing protein 5 [Halocaridina rubra]|uniref:Baculoviral IAP repeat-containing protein 5 n=1 Tax=Halocaridina rubra TaxID=373956 RepID=A0AAN8XDD5_HALRR
MSKEKMAAAGFFFVGNKKEPDLVRCYVCLKELDGWEEEDDPWEEHKSHASHCQYVQLNKKPCELTFEDVHNLDTYRNINYAEKIVQRITEEFRQQAKKTRAIIEKLV